MATHDEIKSAVEKYIAESEAFETKGVKAPASKVPRLAMGIRNLRHNYTDKQQTSKRTS
jgi:hypothetical protein